MRRMSATEISLAVSLLFALWIAPVFAAGSGPVTPPDWQKHDTAVYVVSTLNLLHGPKGEPAALVLQRAGVTDYDVYADRAVPNLYFIELGFAGVGRAPEQPAPTLVYRLGWKLPRSVTPRVANLRIRLAPRSLIHAAQTDPRDLLATFTSLP
jgi:hypothetical protein